MTLELKMLALSIVFLLRSLVWYIATLGIVLVLLSLV